MPHRPLGSGEGERRSPRKDLSQALASAPGGTHRPEPEETITGRVAGGASGMAKSRVQVTGPGWISERPAPSFGDTEDLGPRGPTHLRCHVGRFLVVQEPRSSGSGRQAETDDLLRPLGGVPRAGRALGSGAALDPTQPWGGGRGQCLGRAPRSSASSAPPAARVPPVPPARHSPPPGRAVTL